MEVVGELLQLEVEVLQMKAEEALRTVVVVEEERQKKEGVVLQMQGEVEVEGSRTLVEVVVACSTVVKEQSIRWCLRMKNRRQVGVEEEEVLQKVVEVQYRFVEEGLHRNMSHMQVHMKLEVGLEVEPEVLVVLVAVEVDAFALTQLLAEEEELRYTRGLGLMLLE
jgi:hypothetical protein